MGIISRIFKKSVSKNDLFETFDINLAITMERDYLKETLSLPENKNNAKADCLAQIFINETDFLINSGRLKRQ